MTRNSIRLGTAVLTVAAVALGSTSIAQAKQHCAPAGSRTLASDSYARVYGQNGNAYVCIRSSGARTRLANAAPAADLFSLGGRYVAWSSSDPTDPTVLPHSIVTVMHIPDRHVNPYWYPFRANQPIAGLVVIGDGAAAWGLAAAPGDDTTNAIIQGTDRQGNPPDQFSDDLEGSNVVAGSLHVVSGKTIGWSYADGKTGTQALF